MARKNPSLNWDFDIFYNQELTFSFSSNFSLSSFLPKPKKDSLVSDIRIAIKIKMNPIILFLVKDSIPIKTGIKIPNIDSVAKIKAADDAVANFWPIFCKRRATVVHITAR